MAPAELLGHWRTNRSRLADAAATLDDTTRVEWYGPSMGSKSFLTARLMEAWAHGQDIVDAVGAQRPPTDRLRHIADRAEIGEQREALFAVEIPERPGSFVKFCEAIGDRNLTEFNYRYRDDNSAQIYVGVKVGAEKDARQQLLVELEDKGYPVLDLTEDEISKYHIRHMVGGHADAVTSERVFRFEFPERPGALFNFLNKLGGRWNISMFHYRNHGAAYGRVLAGLQVSAGERKKVAAFLNDLGYTWVEETDNPAYQVFLN